MFLIHSGEEVYNSMYCDTSAVSSWIFIPGVVFGVAMVTQQTRAEKVQP